MRQVDEITNSELDKALDTLTTFWHYTFFGERGVDESTAMVYALEFLACSLGLVSLDEEGDDGHVLMENLVLALDTRAKTTGHKAWVGMAPNLPYSRSLTPA